MIVRIGAGGKSFKGLSDYLTHDPEAETSERVAWTHTLNCANDHVPSAVDEMLWTARDAELLKQEAGIRAGGRATESPVKHISLNWAPGENPTREHMIETTQGFLQHMHWQDHQAILVAHQDKAYSHVHVALNMVHPETGLRLDDNFERRRAQAWALDYEREHGMIYCGQRLLRPEEREAAQTRDAWLAFDEKQKSFAEDEQARAAAAAKIDPEQPKNTRAAEWDMLKQAQREQREQFFAGGKSAFSEVRDSIYREVKGEFRERWADHFQAQKNDGDADELAALKADLIREQRETLAARRDEACAGLRETRDGLYRQLLDGQKDARAELRGWQETGFDDVRFQQLLEGAAATSDQAAFHATAAEVNRPASVSADREMQTVETASETGERIEPQPASAGHMADRAALEVGGTFINFFGGILLNFGETPAPPRERNDDVFQQAADEAGKRQQYDRQIETDEAWRERERTRVWD